MDTSGKPNDTPQSTEVPNAGAPNPTTSSPNPASSPILFSKPGTGRSGDRSVPSHRPSQEITGFNIATLALTVLIFGMLCYALYEQKQDKKALETQIQKSGEELGAAAKRVEAAEARIVELRSDVDVFRKHAGITQRELQEARNLAQRLRQEQEKSFKQLNSQIARKADTQQLSELRQEAESKFGVVNNDVSTVRGDVTAVKTEVSTARQELQNTRRELLDVHEQLRSQVAKNYSELSELRRRGEREYYEFDIVKKNSFQKVADIRLALKKTNPKKKRYDIIVSVDDNTLEKRDRLVNEPVQFLIGKDRLRYELVVFTVSKDRITGYLSTPKDRQLAAERPR